MEKKISFIATLFYSCIGICLLFLSNVAYAVVIGPNTIISVPTTYSNTTVDLSNGNFIVRNGALLTLENCSVIGTVSPTNTNLISVELGSLNLTNNNFAITALLIEPTPKTEASFYAIRLGRASANLTGNHFFVDKQFSVGFLTTSITLPVKNVVIADNKFENWHGVLYLLRSNNTSVDNNLFKLNSSGHIVIVGSDVRITNNSIYFSGLNQLGDAIDLVNTINATVAKNVIFTPTSEGIAMISSENVVLDANTITGGITYGIRIFGVAELRKEKNIISRVVARLAEKRMMKYQTSHKITLSDNFLGQNRYGFAAVDADDVTVTGNFFTQRFDNAASRKFWTNNENLLINVTGLSWLNNTYKEAFTQVNGGDNSNTEFVVFPATGGVVLP